MTTLSFDCSPQPPKGGPMTPEREQAIRDWLERQAFNYSEGLACARNLMEALDAERARVAKLEEPQFSKPGDLPGWVTLPQEEYDGLAARVAKLERVAAAAEALGGGREKRHGSWATDIRGHQQLFAALEASDG